MTRLEQAYRRVLDAEANLNSALESLSVIASNVYGEELNVDLCSGGEIEFRRVVNGDVDNFGCIRFEDIVNRKR